MNVATRSGIELARTMREKCEGRMTEFCTFDEPPAFVPNAITAPSRPQLADRRLLPGLGEALHLPLSEFGRYSVGYLNLLCAEALPDTSDLDLVACLRTLNEWTAIVRCETDRQFYRFRRDPGSFHDSEAYFRILVLITVLQRDLGVTYEPQCVHLREFRHSSEGFLHGLLGGNKRGTCANLPVLYTAVGRSLGYPLYLVTAKGHLFCRWHSTRTGERFNIEGSGRGLNTFADDYYKQWPRPIREQEVYHGIYLRNLEPSEELALFMATRGHFLRDNGHVLDAIVAYSHAHRLAPTDPVYMSFLLDTLNQEIEMRQDGRLPCSYRQAEIFNRDDCPQLACYTIDERYIDRMAGANVRHRIPL